MRLISRTSALVLVLGIAPTPAALADEAIPYERGNALLVRYKCDSCHQAYTAAHGPSLHAIAERYAADPDAQGELETMVLNGSAGVWGTDSAMAPSDIPQADLHTLVEWILSLR